MDIDVQKSKRIHAFTNDDVLSDFDAVKISELLRNKEISVSEVVQASVDRAKKVNPQLNAIVSECF